MAMAGRGGARTLSGLVLRCARPRPAPLAPWRCCCAAPPSPSPRPTHGGDISAVMDALSAQPSAARRPGISQDL